MPKVVRGIGLFLQWITENALLGVGRPEDFDY